MIPAWLADRVGDTHRAARLTTCRRCHTPILAGLDADLCALSVHADAIPLDQTGEVIALLAGRTTYDLTTTSGRKELHYRSTWHIEAARRHPVLATHQCGQSLDMYMQIGSVKEKYVIPNEPAF